jgi:predicted dehydrogenase
MTGSIPAARKVQVGIIGCGEIAQVVHIPTLNFLSDLFQITYLCDISRAALTHCKAKVVGLEAPKTTTDPEELCASPNVDVVFVINSDEYHALHAVLALSHNKHVFVEKPMALNDRDANAIIEAEMLSEGRVMVGYMRRFAPAFEDAIREIGGMDKILYARVRGTLEPAPPSLRGVATRSTKLFTCNNRHYRTQCHIRGAVRNIP